MKEEERDKMFMGFANQLRLASKCKRLSVGAVIFDRKLKSVIATGYNGPAPGCSCGECIPGCKDSIHAEENALARLPHDYLNPCTLYITHSPCIKCARMIEKIPCITEVVFLDPYRDLEGLEYLKKANIKVRQL